MFISPILYCKLFHLKIHDFLISKNASLALFLKVLTMIRIFVKEYDFLEVRRREDVDQLGGYARIKVV